MRAGSVSSPGPALRFNPGLRVLTMEGFQKQCTVNYRTQPIALVDEADKVFKKFMEYLEILKHGR